MIRIRYDKIKYQDLNNLYGWVMSQKLPANDFKWVEETSPFNKDFIKIYNEDNNIEKLLAKLHVKEEHVIHITDLKQALNRELVLKKVHRVIKFNQKAWLKPYIDMNQS